MKTYVGTVVIVMERVLCILTNKRVLRTLFSGQNQFFNTITTFSITYGTNERKKKGKPQKNMQKHAIKEGSISLFSALFYAVND